MGKDHLYFIREAIPDGPIKIGRALDIVERLKKLQMGNPRRLVVAGWIEGGGNKERRIHRAFRHLKARLLGEWYTPGDDLLTFIATSAREWAQPQHGVCEQCGAPCRGRGDRYCSTKCVSDAAHPGIRVNLLPSRYEQRIYQRRRAIVASRPATCAVCGVPIGQEVKGRPRRFCSVACSSMARQRLLSSSMRVCVGCGAEYHPKQRLQAWCSRACAAEHWQGGRKGGVPRKHRATGPCEKCGASFEPSHGGQRFCSRACAGHESAAS